MKKYTSSNFYKSIKRIGFEEEKEVEIIEPSYVKGRKFKIFGIPYGTIKENLYRIPDKYIWYILSCDTEYRYCRCLKYIDIIECLKDDKYFVSIVDDNVHIYEKAHIIIDDDIRYFSSNNEMKQFLSVLKGRCKECGNKLYKSV